MGAFDNLAHEAKHDKPEGIPWNKYPEVKPPKGGKFMACLENGEGLRFWCEAWYDGRQFSFTPNMYGLDDSHVTHWAHINLPNE